MTSCDGVGGWMYGFASLEADGDEGDADCRKKQVLAPFSAEHNQISRGLY